MWYGWIEGEVLRSWAWISLSWGMPFACLRKCRRLCCWRDDEEESDEAGGGMDWEVGEVVSVRLKAMNEGFGNGSHFIFTWWPRVG